MTSDKTGLEILVVDDSRVVRLLIGKQLAILGIEATVVENGAKAFKAASEHQYDLIFMDVNMPVMDGREATAKIRFMEQEEGRQPVPIIGITDFAGCIDSTSGLAAIGMSDFLLKPISIEHLAGVIKNWYPSTIMPEPAMLSRLFASQRPTHLQIA
jgi:two-component system sensor histidine kinase BarA